MNNPEITASKRSAQKVQENQHSLNYIISSPGETYFDVNGDHHEPHHRDDRRKASIPSYDTIHLYDDDIYHPLQHHDDDVDTATALSSSISMGSLTSYGRTHHQSTPGDNVLKPPRRYPQQNDYKTLTWRGDPAETHSDCTIIIVTNKLQTKTFHVHKSVLCFGARQSKYFANLFLNSNPNSKPGGANHQLTMAIPSTKIELDQRDADNFGLMLDFIYAPAASMNDAVLSSTLPTAASTLTAGTSIYSSSTIQNDGPGGKSDASGVLGGEVITSKNAVSLRFLAKKFQVEAFMLAVNKFIQKDLNFQTGPTYLSEGFKYDDGRLVASAQRLLSENFEQVDVKALTKLPYNLFRIVVKSLESFVNNDNDSEEKPLGTAKPEENKELSIFLSDVVCRYMKKNPSALNAEALLELTDPILMPYLSPEAAIALTSLVKDLDSNNAASHWDQLVTLCKRCARFVVQEYGWNDFSVNAAVDEYLNHATSHKRVSRLDTLLFTTSFSAALEQAQQDYEGLASEQQNLLTTVKALNSTVSMMEELQTRKDAIMTRQKTAIEDAKEQIHLLKKQIQQIRVDEEELQMRKQQEEYRRQQLQREQEEYIRQQQEQLQQQRMQLQQQQLEFEQRQQEVHRLQLRQAQTYSRQTAPQSPPSIPTTFSTSTSVAAEKFSRELMSTPDRPVNKKQSKKEKSASKERSGSRPMTVAEIVRDLVSPSEVDGSVCASRLAKAASRGSAMDFRSKEEMRSRSIFK